MRIISLVPSWTETLIACGAEVVGRTRYCIHPAERVATIPVLGGTKQLNWKQWKDLDADLVLMDREENTQTMAATCPFPVFATQVRAIGDVAPACQSLAHRLDNRRLLELGNRWLSVSRNPRPAKSLETIPGIVEWWRRPSVAPSRFLYLIWRKPWMSISPDTFIGSMLGHLGYGWAMPEFDTPYPSLELPEPTGDPPLLLLATEPYPFARHRQKMLALPFPMALIDGEAYSWFGVRSLRFLERQLFVNP